jgi:hypothetical protein
MTEFTMAKRPPKNEPYLHRIARTGDPLQEFYREIVGKSAQIRIPLNDVPDLNRVAIILRVLASKLEVLSKDKTRDFSVLFSARQAIKVADYQIRTARALGKMSEK